MVPIHLLSGKRNCYGYGVEILWSLKSSATSGLPEKEEFVVRVARDLKGVYKLVETGFEYVAEMEGTEIFRKRE